jgi:putative DNA primase/helicase
MIRDLRAIARALGGEVVGGQVLCPGPRHRLRDRSLSVRLSSAAPHGFIAFSHAGDDWRACRDHVSARLGPSREGDPRQPREAHRRPPERRPEGDDHEKKIASALALWSEGTDPRGTLAELYLASRGLDLYDDLAGEVLRWHHRVGAMIALFRDIETDEPCAVSRTFLNCEGRKIGRKFLGPVGGAAVKLDADEELLGGLHIGEGVETCMAAQQIGLRPAWALGSAGAIAAFPVLAGIEALTLLRERDDANARAADQVTLRWQAKGREVFDAWPNVGKDVNDALKGGAA